MGCKACGNSELILFWTGDQRFLGDEGEGNLTNGQEEKRMEGAEGEESRKMAWLE